MVPATLGLGHPGDYDRPCPQFVDGVRGLQGQEQASCG